MSETDVETGGKLTDRLRGKYRIGPATENGEPEFGHRQFNHFTPPIQFEAADAIEALTAENERLRAALREWLLNAVADADPEVGEHPDETDHANWYTLGLSIERLQDLCEIAGIKINYGEMPLDAICRVIDGECAALSPQPESQDNDDICPKCGETYDDEGCPFDGCPMEGMG